MPKYFNCLFLSVGLKTVICISVCTRQAQCSPFKGTKAQTHEVERLYDPSLGSQSDLCVETAVKVETPLRGEALLWNVRG